MYHKSIYICISWYSNICWFPVKKCWFSRTQGVYHVIYIFFLIFLRYVITVPCLIFVGYVWQILGWGWGLFTPPPPSICEQPQKCPSWIGLIDNMVKWFCITYTTKQPLILISIWFPFKTTSQQQNKIFRYIFQYFFSCFIFKFQIRVNLRYFQIL